MVGHAIAARTAIASQLWWRSLTADLQRSDGRVACKKLNAADGISGIEHVGMGIARVDGNAARVAGASTGQCE